MSGRHSNDEPFDPTDTAEFNVVVPEEGTEAVPSVHDQQTPVEDQPKQPPRAFRRVPRTRYLIAGAAAVGVLAIASAGVAAVHYSSAAEPSTQVHVTTPKQTVAPTPSVSPDARRYLDGDRASRAMAGRPTATPSPSGSPSSDRSTRSSSTGGSGSGSGDGGAPVTGGSTCKASFYGDGQNTASGERFNPNAMTAAHKTLPFGTHVRVTNIRNNESVTVRINDRGPYVAGRCLDLSTAAFEKIASTGSGVITVRYEVV
ncbi:hypothetical protein GCM10009765_51870 [Fodinicola feengrottensis]|uniref:Probable endolytic peptidoglycan transglycosylase RlpA n=1 Tax=Fodinicola feengrottensis TaxID=435914 RepID=A0ABN2HZT5_9ACTN